MWTSGDNQTNMIECCGVGMGGAKNEMVEESTVVGDDEVWGERPARELTAAGLLRLCFNQPS